MTVEPPTMSFVVKQGNLCITQELGASSRIRQLNIINIKYDNRRISYIEFI